MLCKWSEALEIIQLSWKKDSNMHRGVGEKEESLKSSLDICYVSLG
jgi:hypothetical protein